MGSLFSRVIPLYLYYLPDLFNTHPCINLFIPSHPGLFIECARWEAVVIEPLRKARPAVVIATISRLRAGRRLGRRTRLPEAIDIWVSARALATGTAALLTRVKEGLVLRGKHAKQLNKLRAKQSNTRLVSSRNKRRAWRGNGMKVQLTSQRKIFGIAPSRMGSTYVLKSSRYTPQAAELSAV